VSKVALAGRRVLQPVYSVWQTCITQFCSATPKFRLKLLRSGVAEAPTYRRHIPF